MRDLNVRETVITLLLWLAMVLTTAAFAVACAILLTGCGPVQYDPTEVDGADGPATDDPGAVCLAEENPCLGVAYCDELGASEQPACNYQADGSCKHWLAPKGLSCFPTADLGVGFCDGKGVCAP